MTAGAANADGDRRPVRSGSVWWHRRRCHRTACEPIGGAQAPAVTSVLQQRRIEDAVVLRDVGDVDAAMPVFLNPDLGVDRPRARSRDAVRDRPRWLRRGEEQVAEARLVLD